MSEMTAERIREIAERWALTIYRQHATYVKANVANAIAEALSEARARWIPVSERLPAIGELVVKHWERLGTYWAGIHEAKDINFSHWMPLRKPTSTDSSAGTVSRKRRNQMNND